MKKRTESDVLRDIILRKHRKKLDEKIYKRRKAEREKIIKIIKESTLKAPVNYNNSRKKGKLVDSKDNKNLKKSPCPNILCLEDDNRDETIAFLNQLPGANNPNRRLRRYKNTNSKNTDPSKKSNYFPFSEIEKICPASTLIISSHYFIYKKRRGAFDIIDYPEWNVEVQDTLEKMGFFDLIGFDLIPADKNLQKIPITGFKSGNKATNEEVTKYFRRLVHEVDGMGTNEDSFKQTASAIFEAVENSVRHAYTDNFPKDVRDRWWLGGILSLNKKEITLVCYDKGISIPKHIKEVALEEKGHRMRAWVNGAINLLIKSTGEEEFDDNLDHIRLKKAMEYAKTSTRKKGSGKGLSHIAKTIEGFKVGSNVKIMSRRAYAEITQNKPPDFTLLDTPIIGTLIIWKIIL